MNSLKTQSLIVAASFILSSLLFSAPTNAVVQSSDHLEVKLKPGEWKLLTWVLISDKEIPTDIEIRKDGTGSDLIQAPHSVKLPGRGTAYVTINASLPKGASVSSSNQIIVLPSLKAIETAPIASSGNSIIVGEASTGVSMTLDFTGQQSGTGTSSTSGPSETSNSSSGTSSSTSSGTSSGTSGGTEGGTATTTTSGGNVSQTTSASSSGSSESGATAAAPNQPAPTVGSQDAVSGGTAAPTAAVSETPVTASAAPDAFVSDVRKSAREIRELREEATTRKAGSSDKHDFGFTRGSLKKVEIEFSENVGDVRTVVNTLAISKVRKVQDVYLGEIDQVVEETDSNGTMTTPPEIVAPERIPANERDVEIDVGGERLPDIESRVIEEVGPIDDDGSVVRKITKKKAYKYLEIDVQGEGAARVERALIDFSVERSWVESNGGDASGVRLNRHVDGNWVELPTRLVNEEGGSYNFVAESPGFSFFVITAAITADITTPIKIEVPEQAAAVEQKDDPVGDLFGTTQPQSLVTINISWLLAVVVLGMVVLFKFNDIKRAMGFIHARQDRVRELEGQRAKYEKMKEETTKRFYKRVISEEEFKNLVMEYDRQLISIETEMAQIKDGKKN